MPRIVYDDLNLSLKTGTGIATYTRELLKIARDLDFHTAVLHSTQRKIPSNPVLREIALFDDEQHFKMSRRQRFGRWARRILSPQGVQPVAIKLRGTVIARSFNGYLADADEIHAAVDIFGRARQRFKTYHRPLMIRFSGSPDIFHCTYPMPLKAKGALSIYTIHDLVPLRLPYLTDDNKRYFYRMIRDITQRADHIITVSEHSRRDIIQMFGVEENRITNTYQAVDIPRDLRDRSVDLAADEIDGLFDLSWKKYLLFIGAFEPKKNVSRLVEAYLASHVDIPLVIVGGAGWKNENDKKFLEDERFGFYQRVNDRTIYRRQIRRFDYVSLPFLVSLIRGARAVVFPSLYEGFGLPILEAMQLGTPVISSTEGSIPEIAGEAAMLVDPYDTDALRQSIRAVSGDDDLCAQLAAAGPVQAARFSSERYRASVHALYTQLLNSRQ